MQRTRRRHDRRQHALALAGLLGLSIILSACGDDDAPRRAATPTATRTALSASPTPSDPPAATVTATRAPALTATLAPTATAPPVPSATATVAPTSTATPPPPTSTATPLPPTSTETPLPPTSTATPPPTATPSPTVPEPTPVRVLMFSRTAGFRHDSIANARALLTALPASEGIAVTATEDPTVFTDGGLAAFDVVAFVNTTGDVLDDAQQAAMQRFIRAGNGYVGVHSAADCEYGWPWYGRLVGAYFRSHPLLPVNVEVTTEYADHPSTDELPATFRFVDEIYNFDRNPRKDHTILLTVDEAGFTFPNTDGGPSMGADHPIAWFKEFEGGRSFYTNLGHRPETWSDPAFIRHLLDGIRWAAEPVQYNRVVLTDELANPMHMAVAPDGRVLMVERTGELKVWSPATGRVTLAAWLDVDTAFENGLLGVVLDPQFAANRFVYLYLSEPVPDPPPAAGPPGENVLARFVLGDDSRLDLGSRLDLLRVPSERQQSHEGGGLAIGPDGTLYVSTGDNTDPFASDGFAPLDERPGHERFNSQRTAANPFDLRGKILRINRDGTIPAGNLFPADGSQGRPEIYVMGCRNPFRIAVDPQTGRLAWGDVGPDALSDSFRGPRGYDEINVADRPGNYGWPYCIADRQPYADFDFASGTAGPRFDCSATQPATVFYDYLTTSYLPLGNALDPEGRSSIPGVGLTGRLAIAGTFSRVPPQAPFALPAPFRDALLMTDWTRDIIAALDVDADGTLRSMQRLLPWEPFVRPIDLEIGPDGALYVLEYGSGYSGDNSDARLSRVEYSATGTLSPVAVAHASATFGAAPLAVTFSADGSRAPGAGDAIVAYEWDFDSDGTVDSRDAATAHTYAAAGGYTASLTVVGRSGRRSLPATVSIIVGNRPAQVTILEPADGALVAPGAEVRLRGEAFDPDSGPVPCDELSWDVRLGHNAHSHPLAEGVGCELTFVARRGEHPEGTAIFFVAELRHVDRGNPGQVPLIGRASIRIDLQEGSDPTPTPQPTPSTLVDLQPVFAAPGTPL
ncbi:MAG: ThuA domain-containing protein, partial [Candidatus Binatia bacterium]